MMLIIESHNRSLVKLGLLDGFSCSIWNSAKMSESILNVYEKITSNKFIFIIQEYIL